MTESNRTPKQLKLVYALCTRLNKDQISVLIDSLKVQTKDFDTLFQNLVSKSGSERECSKAQCLYVKTLVQPYSKEDFNLLIECLNRVLN